MAILKFDIPACRSSQIVGISATGIRIRRALAVSSMPISKPSRESMPTFRTKSVEYALNEFVASRVPMRASSPSDRPGRLRHQPLQQRPADLLAARHVPGGGGDRHAPVHEPREVVDLPGVVAAVGHRHHGDRRGGRGDAVPDRVGRARGRRC